MQELHLTQDQQPMFTKCQVDYYTSAFSMSMFGMGLYLGSMPEVQDMMLNTVSTVLSTADFAAETFFSYPGSTTDLVLEAADETAFMTLSTLDEVSQSMDFSVANEVTYEVADMTFSTLDEVSQYYDYDNIWSFLKSWELAAE